MKRILYTFLLSMLVASFSIAQNKALVFVCDPAGHGTPGESDEQVIEAITAQGGYDITYLDILPLDAEYDLEPMNNADLVIIGRSLNSSSANHDLFDQVTTPILYTSPWVVRGDRAGMVTATGAANVVDNPDAIITANILEPSNPVFAGITETSIVWWTGLYSILNAETGTINGKVLAQTADGQILLSTYDANVPFKSEGDVQRTPAGPRAYMGLGQDNLTPATYFSYSDEAKTIFFNLLAILASGTTPTNDIKSETGNLSVYATTSLVSITMSDLSRVEVYSLDGKMMLSSVAQSNTLELNTTLNNGIYIVKAFNSSGVASTQKFIVR